jgi:hypothetical protein
MDKKEIIDSILVLAPNKADKKILESRNKEELLNILEEAVSAFEDEQAERLATVHAERDAERLLHERRMREASEPQRRAQAKADRKTFAAAARRYGLADNEANFRLAQELLGPAFNEYQVGEIQPGTLSPASLEQIAEYQQEAQAQYQAYLQQASPTELREAAKYETEQRRVQFQREQQTAAIAAREKADAAFGFDPLPSHNSEGHVIDRAYLLRLADSDIKKYRLFCSRYGSANITARLNGVR